MTALIPKEETIQVPSVGGREDREVSRQILGRIIEPRIEEILSFAFKEIVRAGFEDMLAAGVVVSGGTSLMPGIVELAEQVFDMPARRGNPDGVGGLADVVNSPAHAVGVGLIAYGSKHLEGESVESVYGRKIGIVGRISRSIKKFISEFF